ncbi:MAG TPA: trehalose-6-phosphate synthase [Alphaproteobacteria bacterium]|nr:trehalose-6-phosphate synthase [Alphaproteobacteria bacterium]
MRLFWKEIGFGLRVAVPTLIILVCFGLLAVPYVGQLIEHWARYDLTGRSRLIASTFSGNRLTDLQDPGNIKAKRFLNQIRGDEKLYAIGFCNLNGMLLNSSERFFKDYACPRPESDGTPKEHITTLNQPNGLSLHVAAIPLDTIPDDNDESTLTKPRPIGWLVLMHDRAFIANRGAETTQYILYSLMGGGLAIIILTLLVAELTRISWMKSLRRGIRRLQTDTPASQSFSPLLQDIRGLVGQMETERRVWDADALRQIMGYDLSGEEVFVVSNREPYVHHREADGSIRLERPAGGVSTAMEPIVSACNGTWLAWGSGSADRDVANKQGAVQMPPEKPLFTLQRVWLTDAERQGYYNGFANEGLWPLCHLTHTRPVFRSDNWKTYKQVNRKFCDALIKSCKTDNPIILVQDYHFALLPKMIRQRLPQATVVMFWHIPWPNAEQFGICPWREEILDGMLGAHIMGFHTVHHAGNFLESVQSIMEAKVDFARRSVSYRHHHTEVKSYPISIAWPSADEMAGLPGISACRKQVMEQNNLKGQVKIGLGVDRLDYSKGLLERFQALERYLETNPHQVGKVCFIQIASPSRTDIIDYQQHAEEVRREVERINGRFAGRGRAPAIILREKHHDRSTLALYYRTAHFCFVSSLHDGMNLVAKEFVAARDDEQGVLLLSRFTGAALSLPDAILVNPYHLDESAAAIQQAVDMPPDTQRSRMQAMRKQVREYNIYRWAGKMLLDAGEVRRLDAS